ncbi:MAG TPA: c-type cytochrome, partial [Magnetospirillaceae bacterium]|nr:c-type cytochrome [Magnetospirillaceae bacterium]
IGDLIDYLFMLEGRSADGAAAARGRVLFGDRGQCFDCHGGDGKGDPAIGAPDLTDAVWLYGDGSREAIFRSIEHGRKGVCPAWIDRLPPVTIRALAVFLHQQSHSRGTS